jgi:hypothetical protein
MSRNTSGSRCRVSGSTVVIGHRARNEFESHDDVADVQRGARPRSFGEIFDAADKNIRAEAPNIAPERGNCAVGRHKQREHVETLSASRLLQPRIVACGGSDEIQSIPAVPWVTVDQRAMVRARRSAETQQPIVATRGAHAFRAANMHHPVANYAIRSQGGCR